MRAASLMLVFVAAKACMLAGHPVPLSWWSPIAYLWQDAAVALVFAAIELSLAGRPRAAWATYGVVAIYAAANIPVVRVLATPLTWPMLRAARGALSDSIFYYLNWQNASLLIFGLAIAAVAPLFFRRVQWKAVVVALVLGVALGPASARHVDTGGLERNAWTALIASSIPRLDSAPSNAEEWRATGFDRSPQVDLARFAGIAAGRNIVLVSLESTGAQYLGLYGAAPDPTPNLTELARDGVVFENAYAVYPESIKGLFSILCSAYPAFDIAPEAYAQAKCRSVAEVLAGAGYRTGLFHSGRFVYLGMEEVIRNRGFATLEDAGDIGGNHQSSFGVDEPATVARILEWIDATPPGQPFFVTYLPIAGHHPYETEEAGPFPDRDEFGRYRNALHAGDASLGVLIEGLRARGLDQKTLWIVLGDHGEAFGQHEGNYGHTFQLYEENVHVPFLIAAPGLVSGQVRSRKVVSLIDTSPTLLALAGLELPSNYQGTSMLGSEARMALFYADYSQSMLGLRDGSQKFIYEVDSGRSKVFDLERDPGERTNLEAGYRAQGQWYARNLQSWSAAQKRLLVAGSKPHK